MIKLTLIALTFFFNTQVLSQTPARFECDLQKLESCKNNQLPKTCTDGKPCALPVCEDGKPCDLPVCEDGKPCSLTTCEDGKPCCDSGKPCNLPETCTDGIPCDLPKTCDEDTDCN